MALPMEISQDLELITVIGLEHCLAPGNSPHMPAADVKELSKHGVSH